MPFSGPFSDTRPRRLTRLLQPRPAGRRRVRDGSLPCQRIRTPALAIPGQGAPPSSDIADVSRSYDSFGCEFAPAPPEDRLSLPPRLSDAGRSLGAPPSETARGSQLSFCPHRPGAVHTPLRCKGRVEPERSG